MNTSDSVVLHPHLAPDLLLSAIVDSSDDAIVSKDLNGIVTSWNRGAERLFGYSESEMIGQPILKLIPPERSLEEPAILERLRRGERVDHFTTQRICKDGKLVDVSLTISPIRNREGAIVGASKIARDVGAQKQATRALAEAAAEMDRQSRMKDEFLATLSHELRTPLQSIFGWVQLLRSKDHDDPELSEGLAVIERNARAQQKIVDDLLDMNRILSGKARLEVQQVVLAPLIEAAIATARPAADAKGVRIQAVFASDSKLISGDPDRLQQVFWNLLSNAVKFTPKGGRVQILVQPVSSHVEVSVSDTGMGIADEFLPYVFDRFRQADASCTRTQGGLGLGLAIVKHLVELHGGTVRAKSAGIGKGATFEVCLPVTILSAHSIPPRSPVQAEPKPPVSQGRR
jgi:PAS domain S-box-containing protein